MALTAVAAPCAAREAPSPFLPIGTQIDAPRGFVEMCHETRDFCSATPIKADDSVVTAALADAQSMSSVSAEMPLVTVDARLIPIEPPRITFPARSVSCEPVPAAGTGTFGPTWTTLDFPAEGGFARPLVAIPGIETGNWSFGASITANIAYEKPKLSWNACGNTSIGIVRSRGAVWSAAEDKLAAVLAALPPVGMTGDVHGTCPVGFGVPIFTAPSPDPIVAVASPVRTVAATMPSAPMKLLQSVNRYVNGRVRQRTDFELYGRDELWVRSGVGRGAAGDCEDIAIEKRYELIARGFPPGRLAFAVVYSAASGLHTVLIAHDDDGDVVLDSRTPYIRRWSDVGYSWISVQSMGDPMIWRRLA